ncbi:sulfotransferase family 5A, member 1 [Lepisosteus oculatus]|uniref:Sulfotransferase n=1 Tax=Lepisosteus oculatus TaxID=7918 RepID=W5MA50_LEPOC|nr:PREDICTED: sulfotransferase family cytosolic 2B member 1-like [Lepisosteus oculatus]
MARLDITEHCKDIAFPGHMHTQESLQYAQKFKFEDTDTLIVTFPKSGTTWMQETLTLIYSRGDPTLAQSVPNWARSPWLEQFYCPDVLRVCKGPRILTTHLPYHMLASALEGSKAKIIYVARNPKDVAVSYYHFHKMAKFLPEPNSFEDFLDSFLDGTVHYGSWFDHVKGWTRCRNNLNFFYITYEEMLQDTQCSLERLCSFLQLPLLEEELISTQRHCSFNNMKQNNMVNYTLIPQEIMDHTKGQFMRKGKIGDWKNLFSKEQNHRFDDIFEEEMLNTDLTFVWE